MTTPRTLRLFAVLWRYADLPPEYAAAVAERTPTVLWALCRFDREASAALCSYRLDAAILDEAPWGAQVTLMRCDHVPREADGCLVEYDAHVAATRAEAARWAEAARDALVADEWLDCAEVMAAGRAADCAGG